MKKNMIMKERAKGFISGVLLTVLLTSSVAVLANTAFLEVVFNVNHVVVNGNRLNLSEEERPFISAGRTFLPVRAISEALGQPINWDGSTGTVYIGAVPSGSPFLHTVPYYDRSRGHAGNITTPGQVTMAGVAYGGPLVFVGGNTWFTLHNLNAQFTNLSGYIGRVDGTHMSSTTFNFYGDGRLLGSFEIEAQDLPRHISVNVTGVIQLRIESVGTQGAIGSTSRFAFADAMIE
ncbi:MAG: stalk domain-containing protein [Defluviitaleaceae bacterium]|nr:stalk domain-containing protein [Defluviitaleaceae bacterium]